MVCETKLCLSFNEMLEVWLNHHKPIVRPMGFGQKADGCQKAEVRQSWYLVDGIANITFIGPFSYYWDIIDNLSLCFVTL